MSFQSRTLCVSFLLVELWGFAQAPDRPFGIQIVDAETGRGVPLMELRTVNDIRCVTDRAGWVAFSEPGLMERELFFYLSGPGYEVEKDGFGYRGIRVTPRLGDTATFKVKRLQPAERIGRTTGQGIFRDSELLGLPVPVPALMAEVMGQDSVQAVPYRNQILWLWGDTNNPQYPLGNFRTTCANTPRLLKPEVGIVFDYLMDAARPSRLRQMMPIKEQGAVWLFGLLVVRDDDGEEVALAHYGRHLSLSAPVEQGICRLNDASGVFESVKSIDMSETWRFPRGNAVRVTEAEGEFFYFAFPFSHTRVRAKFREVCDPQSYESLAFDQVSQTWRWQKESPPTSQKEEAVLLDAGHMPDHLARYQFKEATSGKTVTLHRASIEWNAWRKKWVLIGVQSGGKEDPSPLGEVWYAESDAVAGPWTRGVKVATHPRYSFYNPVHHSFLDSEEGRIIYFEGTYSLEFSGNPLAPARYDYNQLMYRLDLSGDWIGAMGGRVKK